MATALHCLRRAPAHRPRTGGIALLALGAAALLATGTARAGDLAAGAAGRAPRFWVFTDVPVWDIADEGRPFRATLAWPGTRDLLARVLMAAETRWTASLGYARIPDSYDATTGVFKNPGGDAALVSAGRQYRWNLPRLAGAFTPQLMIESGVNLASRPFPADGTRATIKVITAVEWTCAARDRGEAWTLGIAWAHFSNANLFSRNAGYDGIMLRLGRSWR